MNGALHLCPLEDPLEIVDLGTGTGVWCIEMADAYPEAQILGIDLSPVQPSWVPPNCRFEIDDFELDWQEPSPGGMAFFWVVAHLQVL